MTTPSSDTRRSTAVRAGRIWGAAIVLGLASVVVVNAIVYRLATAEPPALVRPDYYAAALDHDRVWAAERRAAALGLQLSANGATLHLSPASFAAHGAGTLWFTRPNDLRLDYATTTTWFAGTLYPATAPTRGAWDVVLVTRIHGESVRASTRIFVP